MDWLALVDRLNSQISVHGVELRCAFEWEFYVTPAEHGETVVKHIQHHVCIEKLVAEDGGGQWEVSCAPSTPQKALKDISDFAEALAEAAAEHDAVIVSDAKPYADQPASGLHLHISLHDKAGGPLFFKRDNEISAALRYTLGGLLAMMCDTMLLCAPNEKSYLRQQDDMTVSNSVSWGGNNRTVALRLPDHSQSMQRHIEYRVAGADAQPVGVMLVVMLGVLHGLEARPDCGEQVYGNANKTNYGLTLLPQSLEEARLCWQRSMRLSRYLDSDEMNAISASLQLPTPESLQSVAG